MPRVVTKPVNTKSIKKTPSTPKKNPLQRRKRLSPRCLKLISVPCLLLGKSHNFIVGFLVGSVVWSVNTVNQSSMKDINAVGGIINYRESSMTHFEQQKHEESSKWDRYHYQYNYTSPTQIFQKPAKECGAGPTFQKFFDMSYRFRSVRREDQLIYERFFKEGSDNNDANNKNKYKQGGHRYKNKNNDNYQNDLTFVEVGAFDGKEESNTRFFDICLGWTGLLIEANPEIYPRLVKSRRQAHRMNFSPTCIESRQTKGYQDKNQRMVPFYNYPFPNSGLVGYSTTYQGRSTTNVPCGPLGQVLLDVFQGKRISFLSLDVENAEALVLETIDFEKVQIDLLLVSIVNNGCNEKEPCKMRDRVRYIMKEAQYERYSNLIPNSDVYVHPQSPHRYRKDENVKDPSLILTEQAIKSSNGNRNSNTKGQEQQHQPSSTFRNGRLKRLKKYHNRYKYTPPTDTFTSPKNYCGGSPNFEKFFALSSKERSLKDEDKLVYETLFQPGFEEERNALKDSKFTYVELGAFDGREESNTRFFDECLGWNGLLIDGNPAIFDRLIDGRPQAHRMNFVPSCSEDYDAKNGTIPFYPYPLTNAGLPGRATAYTGKDVVQVPCGPLGPVLRDVFQGQRISFFSLDVVTAEPLVLETIDFDAVTIDVMLIRVVSAQCRAKNNCEVRNQVRTKMELEGYQRYSDLLRTADLYIHPDSPHQMPSSSEIKRGKGEQNKDATALNSMKKVGKLKQGEQRSLISNFYDIDIGTRRQHNPSTEISKKSNWLSTLLHFGSILGVDYKAKFSYTPPSSYFSGPIHECGQSPNFDAFFKQGNDARSLMDEDKVLFDALFKDKQNVKYGSTAPTRDFTYVELGAYDGMHESNSRFFDVCLGWEGLLIDGNPGNFQKLVTARPQSHRMHFAPVCQVHDEVDFYMYPLTNVGLVGRAQSYWGKPTVKVPCGPLGPVLKQIFNGRPITLLSLDVENSEPLVLETIDFNEVKIDVLIVASLNNYCRDDCEYRDQARGIMKRAGYQRYSGVVRSSDLYIHPDSPYQLPQRYLFKVREGNLG